MGLIAYFRRGFSTILAVTTLILVALLVALSLYVFLGPYVSRVGTGTEVGKPVLKIEEKGLTGSGSLVLYVSNVGSSEAYVNSVIVRSEGGGAYVIHVGEEIEPGEVKAVVIPSLVISQLNSSSVEVIFNLAEGPSSEGTFKVRLPPARPNVLISLLAYRNRDRDYYHWVVFNYLTGVYRLYDYSGGSTSGPYTGLAPILSGISEYTISTTWKPWSERPIDSPVVIVINPTRADTEWFFTWRDPHGTWVFYLQPLSGEKEIDFLVFWEDLFNPFNPPGSVDDWRDHVVRVTVFSNSTYRIAVYMAKGGYSHEFYLNVTSEVPVEGNLIYRKPFGSFWSRYDSGVGAYVEYLYYIIT